MHHEPWLNSTLVTMVTFVAFFIGIGISCWCIRGTASFVGKYMFRHPWLLSWNCLYRVPRRVQAFVLGAIAILGAVNLLLLFVWLAVADQFLREGGWGIRPFYPPLLALLLSVATWRAYSHIIPSYVDWEILRRRNGGVVRWDKPPVLVTHFASAIAMHVLVDMRWFVLVGAAAELYFGLLPSGSGDVGAPVLRAVLIAPVGSALLLVLYLYAIAYETSHRPYSQLLGLIYSIEFRSSSRRTMPPDPLAGKRQTIAWIADALDRTGQRAELVMPANSNSALSSMFYSASEYMRRYVSLSKSLDPEVDIELRKSLRYVALLLLDTPPFRVYENAAREWATFDDRGQANIGRRHERWARLRAILRASGRAVEPTGRAVQVMGIATLIVVIVTLTVLGRLDLLEVVKRVLQ